MRILITQSGENIFNDEERREIMDKKFRSTTTNKIYRKKLTIEKFNKRKDKKAYDEKKFIRIILSLQEFPISLMIFTQKLPVLFILKL